MLRVDLSLGAWSPRHAALELFAQLGLADAPETVGEGDFINRGVDREARGDGLRLAAYADARRVHAALRECDRVEVLRPRWGLPVRGDNRAFLRYLKALGTEVRIRQATAAASILPGALRLYPGLVGATVVEALGVGRDDPALTALSGDLFLIDPAARTNPRDAPHAIDALARYEPHDPRLHGYVQSLGSALFVGAPALAAFAQTCVQTSPDLAIALGARARACARSPTDAATVDLHRQGICIFLHRFAEAAAARDPSPRLPDTLRAELLTLKGWGKVMVGEIAEAQRCFAAQAAIAADPDAADTLYRRNILALAHFRAGDIDAALAIEESIEATLATQDDPDAQLRFVNAINLARLHRARKDGERYRAYLARAFATSDTLRSASEILQLNLLHSEAYSAIDPALAKAALLRAAFVWLATEPSAALSVRALRLFAGAEAAHPRALDALVARAIDARLAAAWPDVASAPIVSLPLVALTDDEPAARATALVETAGICLLRARDRFPRLPRSSATHALAARAVAIAGLDQPEDGSWLIDCAAGLDVGVTPGAVRAAAWRHGLAAQPPAICVGAAVRRVEGARVIFRRHRAPFDLTPEAEALVARASAGAFVHDATPLVTDLIERRVLEACDAA